MLGTWHSHANGMVRQVAAHPDEFELIGGWDPDPMIAADRCHQWRELLPEYRLFSGPLEVLEAGLDGVLVEGQVDQNLGLARQALEAGLPVLLEKPAGTSYTEYLEVLELARRQGLHLQMAYLFRYMSAIRELLRRVRAGELGQVYSVRGRLPKFGSTYDFFRDQLRNYRGGIFFEMGSHLIDLMVAMLGPPQSVQRGLAHHHRSPGEYVDHGVALLGWDGAWGIAEVPALEVSEDCRRIEVYGTEGIAVLPTLGSGHLKNQAVQALELCDKAGEWTRLELPAATLQIADLREFAACVRGEREPEFSMDHDQEVQRVVLEASDML